MTSPLASLTSSSRPRLMLVDGEGAGPAAAGAEAAQGRSALVERAVEEALARIAPTFPLDRLVAVNPLWGFIDRPIAEVAARVGLLGGATLLPSRRIHREAFRAGRMGREHLQAAIDEADAPLGAATLLGALERDELLPSPLPLVTDRLDETRDLTRLLSWREVVRGNVSQHCAACFDQHQAAWSPLRGERLYASWQARMAADHGLGTLTGDRSLSSRAAALPRGVRALLVAATRALALPDHALTEYFTALLLDVGGWAAYCAGLRFSARLEGRDDEQLRELLAVRLAWEWLLDGVEGDAARRQAWRSAWSFHREHAAQIQSGQRLDWLLLGAAERAYQLSLCDGMARAEVRREPPPPEVQAVFCIDVRSEPLRRALEGQSPAVRTYGFAGFFGLPVAFTPFATSGRRAQLPALLAPSVEATDEPACEAPGTAARARRSSLRWSAAWGRFRRAAASAFSYVEACGWTYAGALWRAGSPGGTARPPSSDEALGLPRLPRGATARPRIARTVDVEARATLAQGALRGIGLGAPFAPLVLIAGHGSANVNNAHAAGLDCGACGGNPGEVNARLLAGLLNDPQVRTALAARGIELPVTTWFVAGLHDTTTDEVELHDADTAPSEFGSALARLRSWLRAASARARASRAPLPGAPTTDDGGGKLPDAARRARDAAELRPEWGLAGNAAFVAAPRARTAHLDLGGRVFLHDYDCRLDRDGAILESILDGPLVVAHFINFQYFASTVDPLHFGSGNKLLHNVVGGNLGVFEGNGGDLRIGLPWQSLHDGEQLRHRPLRLSVYLEAPREVVDELLARKETVRRLVDNGWIHLFRIEPGGSRIARRRDGGWEPGWGRPRLA